MQPLQKFFIGIDSDGCVFDTMEIKHKECFCPAFILHFTLQPIAKFARESWEFVNLYSKTRGCNRFIAVNKTLDLLRSRKKVRERNANVPVMKALNEWTSSETKLSNQALKDACDRTNNPELKLVFDWSSDVNLSIKKLVKGVPPFPHVVECLEIISNKADAIVVSQTPAEALNREWKENRLTPFIRTICGQEVGSKAEQLQFASQNRYDPGCILMIGDSPGDLQAAKKSSALFFPIIPGQEEESWKQLFSEGLERFFNGSFSGDYETQLIASFQKRLPEDPPWQD
ncbi:MAG: HAD hydrolase-like protein [Spirochaetales bacterium]|nr:HAD hydrolase-like protein [Spirochaetales bacterium]